MSTPFGLDQLTEDWQHALDAARDALESSDKAFRPDELGERRRALTEERRRTEELLDDVARVDHAAQLPWLAATRIRPRALGLDAGVRVCIFDLDGVLTDSGRAHAAAWSDVFAAFLLQHAEETGLPAAPFDPEADYRAFLDGKPRLEGIHGFLASRGIRLPDGRRSDAAEARTAYGLARRKSDALERVLHRRGVTALPGARKYLEAVGHAGLDRAVVSCSQRTNEMLSLAGLTPLVEATIDASAIEAGALRSRPAPDVLLAICQTLDVDPVAAVTFTHTPAGVAAGHSADMTIVGVGDEELLAGFGAERVVPSLVSLLDPALR